MTKKQLFFHVAGLFIVPLIISGGMSAQLGSPDLFLFVFGLEAFFGWMFWFARVINNWV